MPLQGKAQGQQFFQSPGFTSALRAHQPDHEILSAELRQYLPADTAGREQPGDDTILATADGDGSEIPVAVIYCLENGSALSADRGAVGAVFDVAALIHSAVGAQQRRAHLIAGIGAVGMGHGLFRQVHQFLGSHSLASCLFFIIVAKSTGICKVFRISPLQNKKFVGQFTPEAMPDSRVFPVPLRYNGYTIYEGGMAMQCQKLKTYMETGRVLFLPPRSIRPNPSQPRRIFQDEALAELADSIRQHGILQPLSVRRVGAGYELIAGERRLRAAQLAGLNEIPCILMNMDDRESGMAALVENLQRQDLDFIEEARGICDLMTQWSMSQEQAARLLGKSQSAIANKLRLLRHSPRVLQALREGGLTERHGRALLKLPTEEEKLAAITVIVRQSMSVARAEKYIQQLLTQAGEKAARVNVGAFLNSLNQSLARIQSAGISAVSERRETEDQIVLTITIPK